MPTRSLDQLLNTEEPAWPYVQEWITSASNPVEVLPASERARRSALLQAQVTIRSPMGAVIYETGGLLIDHGWIRVLGSGHPRLPRTLPEWNEGRSWHHLDSSPPFPLVADDVVGGFFAINGDALGNDPGSLYYFAQDRLKWEPMGLNYSNFLGWTLSGDLATYYADTRWTGWQAEVASMPGHRAMNFYPPLFTNPGPVDDRSRRPIPLAEIYDMYVNFFASEINGADESHTPLLPCSPLESDRL